MKHLTSINKYFWRYKWLFILGILFVVLTNYFRILAPQLTGYIVNDVVADIASGKQPAATSNYDIIVQKLIAYYKTSHQNKVMLTGITLLLLAILSGFFMFLMRQTLIVMSRHIEYDQKNEIYQKYQKLSASFYKVNFTGDLMNRISEDVSRVRMYTGPALMYFINLAAVIGFNVYFMLQASVKLTIVTLAPLPLLAIAIYFVNTIINKRSETIQGLLSQLTSNAQETYSGIRVVKSFAQENSMFSFFKANSEAYKTNAIGLAKVESIYFPSMSLLIGISTLLTILVGSYDVLHGVNGASVGTITEFILYIQMLTFPVSAIGWTASMIQRAAVSQRRINEFMDYEAHKENENDSKKQVALKGAIELQNISLTYANTGVQALKNINLSIKPGEKIAIVGRTGSGKSTLAQVLLKLFETDKGNIQFDSHSLQDIASDSLREQISYVPQDVFLFSDSVLNNIRFNDELIVDKDVEDAAKMACVHDEILSLKDGYNTIVGERGITLSGGQKQRISIARALVKHPRILILDDCLSAVDATTEKNLLQNLSGYLKNKTAIIITHRVFSLFEMDKIVVMEAGQIVEVGHHEELMKNDSYYKNLYEQQLKQNSKK